MPAHMRQMNKVVRLGSAVLHRSKKYATTTCRGWPSTAHRPYQQRKPTSVDDWRYATALLLLVLVPMEERRRGSSRGQAHASWWPESLWWGKEKSPFESAKWSKLLEKRRKADEEWHQYVRDQRPQLDELLRKRQNEEITQQELNTELGRMKTELTYKMHMIMYGITEPALRPDYMLKYGGARWTPEALKAIAKHSPLVQLLAGKGHWAKALEQAGANIIAYDDGSPGLLPGNFKPVTRVLEGREDVLVNHENRALLIVYPRPTDSALRCLKAFTGKTFIYVGEGRGGYNADNEFFDTLEDEWAVQQVLDLECFPQCMERVYIMQRRPEKAAAKRREARARLAEKKLKEEAVAKQKLEDELAAMHKAAQAARPGSLTRESAVAPPAGGFAPAPVAAQAPASGPTSAAASSPSGAAVAGDAHLKAAQ